MKGIPNALLATVIKKERKRREDGTYRYHVVIQRRLLAKAREEQKTTRAYPGMNKVVCKHGGGRCEAERLELNKSFYRRLAADAPWRQEKNTDPALLRHKLRRDDPWCEIREMPEQMLFI